jgi:hypothetical protein
MLLPSMKRAVPTACSQSSIAGRKAHIGKLAAGILHVHQPTGLEDA